MKNLFLTLAFLCMTLIPAHAQYNAQYAARYQSELNKTEENTAPSPELTPLELKSMMCDYDYFATPQDASRIEKQTGVGLLATGGVLSATGIVLYGMAIGGLDRDLSIAGLATFAAAVPFYVVGSIFYVKGKRGLEASVTPAGVALRF